MNFLPNVWADQLRDQLEKTPLLTVTWEPDTPEQEAAKEARKAKREADRAALLAKLAEAPEQLQPIIELHSPNRIDECQGCDYSGYEGDPPDWPCRTIRLIAGEDVNI